MIFEKLLLTVGPKGRLRPLAITPTIFNTHRTTLKLLSLMSLRMTSVTGLKSVFASFGTLASFTKSYISFVFSFHLGALITLSDHF